MAGVAWQAIHYLLGLRRLGWDVYYVEDSGAAPYDPRHGGRTDDPAYSVGYVADVMRRFGFEDRWVYLDMARDETYGLSRGRLGELYRQAAGILNLCGATAPRDPGAACFTTVASWENKGKDISFRGETYQWSKHVNFLRFLDLPRHAVGRFELAMDPVDPAVTARLRDAGWTLVDPAPISRDPERYRAFIRASRGEFTVAKDIYVRPRSGWFSDRSVCYLAAGRPVVTQDTGVGKFVPTGRGLLTYGT